MTYNKVLEEIIATGAVTRGQETIKIHSGIRHEVGEFLYSLYSDANPKNSIEIGFAYGISTLYTCDALSKHERDWHHTVIDPVQSTQWQGVGLSNIQRAGYGDLVTLIEEGSETALPRLMSGNRTFDAAFIDGWHSFDHALVDFFYLNRMLKVGGLIILDDAHYPSIARLAKMIRTYPCYEHLGSKTVQRSKKKPLSFNKWLKRLVSKKYRRGPEIRCVAFKKVTEDERDFDWYQEF